MQAEGEEVAGSSYLIINTTNTDLVTDLDGSDVWKSLTLKDNYTFGNNTQGTKNKSFITIQFTLYMTTFKAQEMEINATRAASSAPEPTVLWNTSTATYDIKEKWNKRPEFMILTGGAFSTVRALEAVGLDDMYKTTLNAAQYSIFTSIATYTADPSLALQAYFTTICALCYYDRITMFDKAVASLQVSLVQATQLLGWTAFIIVAGMTVLYLLLVLVIISLFRRAGSLSQIGDAWASVSQLLGPTTDSWIRNAGAVKDSMIKSWLKDNGLDRILVRVEYSQTCVELVKKEKAL
ncbi:hypothetical protein BKA59DRAFT_461178 [Fusarium tricinctum]|uniref:Uncharacterized protein n=1 Tax=Fusarium tricinctum TaxID=61284 RepID=A0A8K0RQK6_9HYPO|nr:hypothetical protein BKA59DRAFT_461178 [Fusarium tricinctum]